MLGDFNVVRSKEERFNSSFCQVSSNCFNAFINNAHLFGFPMGGKRYTYMTGDGSKLIKIDKILLRNSLIRWPHDALTALPHEYSDHCPLILSSTSFDFCPTLLRFYNSRLQLQDLTEIVTNACSGIVLYGPADKACATRLKAIKMTIRNWRNVESVTTQKFHF